MFDNLRDQHDTDYHNDNQVIKLSIKMNVLMTNNGDDNEDGSHILHLVDFLSASIELPPDGSSLLVSQVELVKKTMSIMGTTRKMTRMILLIFKIIIIPICLAL